MKEIKKSINYYGSRLDLDQVIADCNFRPIKYRDCNSTKIEWYINPECNILKVKDPKKHKAEVAWSIYVYNPNTSKNNAGYHLVNIGFTALLHRVMASTYLPPSDNPLATCVDHIDQSNKDDNTINNLRWVTYKENMKYYFENKKANAI